MEVTSPEAAVLWYWPAEQTTDLCRLETLDTGHRLSGSVLTVRDGVPWEGRYVVDCDGGWRTRKVVIEALGPDGESTMLDLLANGGGVWQHASGEPVLEDADVLDVDLRLTPATNTMPIRRLGLAVGGSAELKALWVDFPTLEYEALSQTYTRLAERRWRYAAGTFAAELEVDEHGLVVRYGDLWREVARWDRR